MLLVLMLLLVSQLLQVLIKCVLVVKFLVLVEFFVSLVKVRSGMLFLSVVKCMLMRGICESCGDKFQLGMDLFCFFGRQLFFMLECMLGQLIFFYFVEDFSGKLVCCLCSVMKCVYFLIVGRMDCVLCVQVMWLKVIGVIFLMLIEVIVLKILRKLM